MSRLQISAMGTSERLRCDLETTRMLVEYTVAKRTRLNVHSDWKTWNPVREETNNRFSTALTPKNLVEEMTSMYRAQMEDHTQYVCSKE